jgi:hypothetical protein
MLTGEQLKREGQQLAIDFAGDWPERVLLELRGWCAIEKARGMTTMTVEAFRASTTNEPRTHYCWGSVPRLAIKAGIIKPALHADGSPVMRNAAAPRTRAHPIRVYHITGGGN